MKILHEDGCYTSFCPLSCISWLIEENNNAFFIVLGSMSCSHFMHQPRPLRLSKHPKVATIVLEEEEISLGIRENSLIPLVKEIIEEYSPKIVFLLGSCFIEIQKLDLRYAAHFLEKHFNLKFVPVNLSGFKNTYSYGEDALLSSLLELCPQPAKKKKEVVIIGTISPEGKKMFEEELKTLNVPFGGFLPSPDISDLPCISEETLICPLHPYLIHTLDKISRERKSKILNSLFPIGIEGTKDFFSEILRHFNIPYQNTEIKLPFSKEDLAKEKKYIKNIKIFLIGDNLLELPLARFLNSCGAEIVEAGTPYIHSLYHKKEISYLEKFNIPVVESPNNIRQLEKIKKTKPDMIISPLVFSYPLENMGFTTVWSVKFFLTGTCIHGFDNVLLLLKIFTNSLRKKR